MASSRRTYDTDTITLRQVFAKNGNNTNIPALRVLTADGAGGTYWAIPSTLGENPAFNQIITSAGTYTADLSYNRFRLLAGENMGMYDGPPGSNQTTLFAKAYSQIDVSGENTLLAFANGILDPSLKIAGEGGIQVRADPATNTLFINGPAPPIFNISTGIYGFNQIKVMETTSSITSSVQDLDGTFITADSPSTLLRFLGYNDIQLSTNTTTNSVYFTISTFTSQDYLNISNAAFSAYPSSISTVSSLYVRLDQFYSSIGFFSSQTGFGFSSVVSSINALAMSTGSNFYILSGLINERLTIAQFLQYQADDRQTLNSTMASTVVGLGTAGYLSTAVALVSSSQEFLTSSIIGLGSAGYISSLGVSDQILQSTIEGLGTLGYVSSAGVSDPSLRSTVIGLGTVGYISSLSTIITSSIFNTGAISTYDLEVYGSNTFSVRGNAFFRGPTNISTLTVSSINNIAASAFGGGGGSASFPSSISTQYGSILNTGILNASTISYVNVNPSTTSLWFICMSYNIGGVTTFQPGKYSSDGINWTSFDFPFWPLSIGYNGKMWVGIGIPKINSTFPGAYYSYDGFTWTAASSLAFFYGYSVAWNGQMWVGVGIGEFFFENITIKYSYNGIDWLNCSGSLFVADNSSRYGGFDVAWNGMMWVAVGYDTTTNGTIKYSYDGKTWNNSSGVGFARYGKGVAWNGNMWVAVGDNNNTFARSETIKYSYDGINWSNSEGFGFGPNGSGEDVAWNGKYWLAAGSTSLQSSVDGIRWSTITGFTSFTVNAITWNGMMWVATNNSPTTSNTVQYSYNGFDWFVAPSGAFTNGGGKITFSSNITPSYSQTNLSILPNAMPTFFTSTNSIFLEPSSMTINNVLLIDKNLDRVSINCNLPQYTLDVNGSLNVSSIFINNSSFGLQTFRSTVQGLGSSRYLSSASLISTVEGLGSASYLSSLNMISTNIGLGSLGYISSLDNVLTRSFLNTALQSTTAGIYSSFQSTASALNRLDYPSTVSTNYGRTFLTSNLAVSTLNAGTVFANTLTTSTISFVNVRPSTIALWVAVGSDTTANNRIKYSFNGINWGNSSGATFTGSANAAAWNGQLWVAVGGDSTDTNTLKYSFDGINWSNSVGLGTGFTSSGQGIAWNGRMWVAVGYDAFSKIKYSFNGINWSNISANDFDSGAEGIAWNGVMWVAVGADSTQNNTIKYSFDGINWSNSLGSGFSIYGSDIAWSGRVWVAVGNDDTQTNKIKYSFDGITWQNANSTSFGIAFGVAWNGRMFVAVGSGNPINKSIQYSFDGINWLESRTGGFNFWGNSVSWNGEYWIAVGRDSTSNNTIQYSYDGINWTNSSTGGFTSQGYGIAFSSNTIPSYNQNNLSILPTNTPSFFTSTNTIFPQPSSLMINNTLLIDGQWDRVGINCNLPQYSLDVGGSANVSSFFINTSSFTNILTSTVAGLGTGANNFFDTVVFSSLTTSSINRVLVPPSRSNVFVAVGYGNSGGTSSIQYSYDGINWSNGNNNVPSISFWTGNSVAYNGSMWLAGGDVLGSGSYAGDIIYSYDAVNWAPVGASQIFGNDVKYVGWNGQFWLALGSTPNSGTRIKYSANGFTWSNITGNDFNDWGAAAAWNGTMWVAVGTGTAGTSSIKYSFDTSNWFNASAPAGLNYGTGVTFGKNVWVASFFSSNVNTSILYSSNGKNWRAIQSGGFPPIEFAFTDNYGYTVAFNGVYFLAGGAVNTSFPGSNAGLSSIQISFDGLNWSNARSGLLNTPSGFSWSGTMWVGAFNALSTRSTLRYSYNGLDWFAAQSGGFSNASFNNWGKAAAFSSNASGALNVAGLAIPENSIVNNMNTTNTIFSYVSSVVLNNILVVDRASNAVAINKTIGDYTLDVNGSLNMSSLFINASSINSVVTDVILRVTSGAVGAAAISTFSTLVTSSIAFVNVPPPQQCNLYIAVGYDTTASNTIRWSIDGFTWSNILSGGFTNFGNGGGFDVAFGGNMWVGVGTDSPDNNQTIIYSSNGLNWFEATGSLFTNGYGVAWNGRLWVAVGQDATSNGTIKYSGNGMVWSNARTGGFGTGSSKGQCVAWNGFQWLAGGFSSGGANEVYVQNSVDGINWSRSASFPAGTSVVNALSWNGKLWVAGVYLSFGPASWSLRYSYDGLTWFLSEGLGYSFGLSDVEWNGLYFLAAGYDSSTANYIQLSYDGIRWISMNQTGLGSDPTGLIWNGRYWIATANDGVMYTSYDARVWTAATGSMNIAGYGLAYSSNAIQSYRQPNLEIAMNPIPIFLNSTNNIYATLSTVVINHGLYVSKQNGNVGIGIGLPRKALDVNGEVQSISVSTMQLFASSIGVGVSTVRYSLDVRGNGSFSTLTITGGAIVASTNTDFALTVFGTQGVARVGGTTWTAISDQRVKENIVSADLDRCYSDIKNIPLRRFTYTSTFFQDYNLKDKNVLGFIAQEVSTVQPKAITISPGFGISDMMWLNIDQLNMSLYGSVKKLIQDKEAADSTIRGQAFHLETLNGRMESMFSTLEGLQGR